MTAWLPDILGLERALPALAAILGAAYLIGSIPFGLLITRALGLGDVRKIGSGNIGTTNVLRTGSKKAAALTLLLDGGKGAVAVAVAYGMYGNLAAQIAALGAFLGHLYPVWLRFKGGKGVATFLGVMLALHWPAGLLACATWLASAVLFRMSSLAALIAAAMVPLWLWLTRAEPFIWLSLCLAALIFVKHHANIRRIAKGTEPRIGKS